MTTARILPHVNGLHGPVIIFLHDHQQPSFTLAIWATGFFPLSPCGVWLLSGKETLFPGNFKQVGNPGEGLAGFHHFVSQDFTLFIIEDNQLVQIDPDDFGRKVLPIGFKGLLKTGFPSLPTYSTPVGSL